MEDIQLVSDWVGVAEQAWFIGSAVTAVFGYVLHLWRTRTLSGRIRTLEKRLEEEAGAPSISQTFIYNPAPDPRDEAHEIRTAMEKTAQDLRETMRRLPQEPLGDGHTLARLPDGTNIVSRADGSYRLAVPIPLSVSFSGAMTGKLSTTLIHRKAKDRKQENSE